MLRRVLAPVACLALLTLLLAACGAAPSAAPRAEQAAPAQAPTQTLAPKPAEAVQPAAAATAALPQSDAPAATQAPVEAPQAAAPAPPAAENPAAEAVPTQEAANRVGSGQTTPEVESTVAGFVADATAAPEGTSDAVAKSTELQPESAAPASEPMTALAPPEEGVVATEPRVIELEFPSQMKLGDSEVVRVGLVPSAQGYSITVDIATNETFTTPVVIDRPLGYRVEAGALLTGVNFDIDQGQQHAALVENERLDFRWTISAKQPGQQRLSLTLKLHWIALDGTADKETVLLARPLSVQVNSLLGLTSVQATQAGVAGLALGAAVSVIALAASPRGRKLRQTLGFAEPNARLVIEAQPAMQVGGEDGRLLQTLFRRYARLVLEREFRSGYSGARTFLALPIREDGRADAYTIAKIGDKASIQQEFENFEQFVKDTLPPITARIQEVPLTISGAAHDRAIMRYTFIGEPGKLPVSLREALLANSDPAPVIKLFDTFGPNWWMQRKPHAFRVAEEYDRMLPAHYVLQRVDAPRQTVGVLDGSHAPSAEAFGIGDVVQLKNFGGVERRADGSGYSLTGSATPGQPPLRARFLTELSSGGPQEPMYGRITATRDTLLRGYVEGFDRFGLADPLLKLERVVNENIQGTQSTIHGDLNLENVLIGLGGIVWLIDFALTRDGHPLYDFAHLEADVIAHVIAPQIADPRDFLNLAQNAPQFESLRAAMRAMALRCLFNPSQPREYDIALYMACTGALKYANLNAHQKHVLYLAAAQIAQRL